MKPNFRSLKVLVVFAVMSFSWIAAAADRPYTEGPVSVVTAIKTVDGMSDDYLAWLAGPWKQENEALKKAGLILDYRVYGAAPRNPNEPDLYLEVIYKNWAAFDGLADKSDPISEKVHGSQQKANAGQVARGKMRTILGSQVIQELKLK